MPLLLMSLYRDHSYADTAFAPSAFANIFDHLQSSLGRTANELASINQSIVFIATLPSSMCSGIMIMLRQS